MQDFEFPAMKAVVRWQWAKYETRLNTFVLVVIKWYIEGISTQAIHLNLNINIPFSMEPLRWSAFYWSYLVRPSVRIEIECVFGQWLESNRPLLLRRRAHFVGQSFTCKLRDAKASQSFGEIICRAGGRHRAKENALLLRNGCKGFGQNEIARIVRSDLWLFSKRMIEFLMVLFMRRKKNVSIAKFKYRISGRMMF